MRPDQMPRQPDEGPQPLSLAVPIYNKTEVDLMGSLENLVLQFNSFPFDGFDDANARCAGEGVRRAVDWLHAKYGTRRVANCCCDGGTGGAQ